MPEDTVRVLAVIGSQNKNSVTRVVINHAAGLLRTAGAEVSVFDYLTEPLPLFNVDTSYEAPVYQALQPKVEQADVYLLGTPDYHGGMSSAMKSFLDHFWKEFAGKLFATVVASHEKGLTVTDQLRTTARQCYAWSMPYGLSFTEGDDVRGEEIVSDPFRQRLAMWARDVHVYGGILAKQRRADLAGNDPGFLARHRKKG
jgi:NAD(P)H-dependent FMN reductase